MTGGVDGSVHQSGEECLNLCVAFVVESVSRKIVFFFLQSDFCDLTLNSLCFLIGFKRVGGELVGP